MKEEIICAGFGGQGIMLLGKILAQAYLKAGKKVIWFPSYGAAMRGGCTFCMVVVSDKEISSPYIDRCDTLLVFNQPSWERFKGRVRKGGLVLLNSTLIQAKNAPRQFKIRRVAFTDLASSLGNVRVANMVALGSYLKQRNILTQKDIAALLSEIAPPNKRHLLEVNKKALLEGYQA